MTVQVVQAEFAATLVDEWARAGVREAVVSPGSRSTPLVTALASDERIRTHVRLDERSAAFFALGLALGSGTPSLFVTTSGTAACEAHAAVVEAHQACVPLVVCTADRPPELRDVGAPQAVDQRDLFGTAVRWSVDPGVPAADARASWRPLAARVLAAAAHHPAGPGPVHLNLPFREPLVGEQEAVPAGRDDDQPWLRVVGAGTPAAADLEPVARLLEAAERGIVVVGDEVGATEDLYALAATLDWPLLAGPRTSGRRPDPLLVTTADALLRQRAFADAHRPDVVLRAGPPPVSRVVSEWLAGCGARAHVLVDGRWPWRDPDGSATHLVAATPAIAVPALAALLGSRRAPGSAWAGSWQSAEQAAQAAIQEVLDDEASLTEPAVARALYASVPDGSTIVASSSMPVRDLEWFAAPRRQAPRVLCNRGANGIDGVTSTALGVAAVAAPGSVTAMVGDLAFLHDLSALVWGPEGPPAATVVVVDNGGGGIFSFLPQAAALPPAVFERFFGTPHATDVAGVARATGCAVVEVRSAGELQSALAASPAGLRVVVARTDRARNVAVHESLNTAVAARLEEAAPREEGHPRTC